MGGSINSVLGVSGFVTQIEVDDALFDMEKDELREL